MEGGGVRGRMVRENGECMHIGVAVWNEGVTKDRGWGGWGG